MTARPEWNFMVTMKIGVAFALILASSPAISQEGSETEACDVLDAGVYRQICECQQVTGATDRLDCYDRIAMIQEIVRMRITARLRQIAENPQARDVMRSFVEDLEEQQD